MSVVHLLICYVNILLFSDVNTLRITIDKPIFSNETVDCVTEIVKKYYTDHNVLTYIGNKNDDLQLLQSINYKNMITMLARPSSARMLVPQTRYLLCPRSSSWFAMLFPRLIEERTWNPLARFLILVRTLDDENGLQVMFDLLLKLHVLNVVVLHATKEVSTMYTYNPYDNYGCGKRYDKIIRLGTCADIRSIDLFPEKIHTGLHNCTLNVLISQWPPYTILATNNSGESFSLEHGVEPYLLRVIGEIEGFDINLLYNYNVTEDYPTVSITSMKAVGTLKMIQDNEADVAAGGMLLTPTRALAFDYMYGHLAYTDEIRFIVKRASNVPEWKNIYLEFEATVWILLILALLFYSLLIFLLLRSDDMGSIVLKLLDNLVLHGCNIPCRTIVKCVLICWVWFAYLVNSFYQSNLVSLTTNPVQEYQISNEEDIIKYQLKACFSPLMMKYYVESVQTDNFNNSTDGCGDMVESVKTVINSKDAYTIILDGVLQYNQEKFLDEYGKSRAFSFDKPYSKVIYSIFIYKGFPFMKQFRRHSLLLAQNGIVNKVLNDMKYINQLKHRFREKEHVVSFTIPWVVFGFGCTISIITFIIEVLSKQN